MTGTNQRSTGDRDATVVEYCANNVTCERRPPMAALTCETRRWPCLERCGTCRTTPFLVVEGTLRTGDSHETLCDRVGGESP